MYNVSVLQTSILSSWFCVFLSSSFCIVYILNIPNLTTYYRFVFPQDISNHPYASYYAKLFSHLLTYNSVPNYYLLFRSGI